MTRTDLFTTPPRAPQCARVWPWTVAGRPCPVLDIGLRPVDGGLWMASVVVPGRHSTTPGLSPGFGPVFAAVERAEILDLLDDYAADPVACLRRWFGLDAQRLARSLTRAGTTPRGHTPPEAWAACRARTTGRAAA